MKLLLVTLYFPPAGGGGVQRPLKLASHLPALGVETHVLAPDDPIWPHEDAELPLPTQAWVHRARYVGPRGRRIGDELQGRSGVDLMVRRAATAGRRLLVPDENVTWNATAIPKAIAIARREGIDIVLTTSPPASVHLIGAAVKTATGAKWVADLRDSLRAHPQPDADRLAGRAKEQAQRGVAALVARQADAIVAAARAIEDEARALGPRGRVVTIADGCDFDDFAGLGYRRAERFRITHAGSSSGRRDPRPFLQALADSGLEDVLVRFLGDLRPADREFLDGLGLADRVELIPRASHRGALELQRDSDVVLLLPEDGGDLSGTVFECLAAERPVLALVPPDGAAAALIRGAGTGVVAAPDDVGAIRDALLELHARWRAGGLDGALAPEWRERLSRGRRVEELADLLTSLV